MHCKCDAFYPFLNCAIAATPFIERIAEGQVQKAISHRGHREGPGLGQKNYLLRRQCGMRCLVAVGTNLQAMGSERERRVTGTKTKDLVGASHSLPLACIKNDTISRWRPKEPQDYPSVSIGSLPAQNLCATGLRGCLKRNDGRSAWISRRCSSGGRLACLWSITLKEAFGKYVRVLRPGSHACCSRWKEVTWSFFMDSSRRIARRPSPILTWHDNDSGNLGVHHEPQSAYRL